MSGFTLFIAGFVAKVVTGLDDALTNTGVIQAVTHTRAGRFAFAGGMFVMLLFVLALASWLGGLITSIPYANLIVSAMLVILGLLVYFDVFVHKPREKCCAYIEGNPITPALPLNMRILRGFGFGMLAYGVVSLDEFIVYASILRRPFTEQVFASAGIITAALFEIAAVLFFAYLLAKIPHKNRIAGGGLLMLAILTGFGVL